MEERKKVHPLGMIGLILLFLALILLCIGSLGLKDWSLGYGRWGVYATGADDLYLSRAYELTDTGDLLICDRNAPMEDGALVTYLLEGRRVVDLYDGASGRPILLKEGQGGAPVERVAYLLENGGTLARSLYAFRWAFRGGLAALILAVILWRATAEARWRRRQQKQFGRRLQEFGRQYREEEAELQD